MSNFSDIFKAYDVRGIYPGQINADVAYRVGQAFSAVIKPRVVVVGQDVRAHGSELKETLIAGLIESGVEVIDIGVITTDQLYFAVGNYGYDAGVSVTASHNPGDYNGFKFSEKGGAPIASDHLLQMREWAESDKQILVEHKGRVSSLKILDDYVEHVLSYVDTSKIKPLHILANANFGAVGRSIDKIVSKLKLKVERLNWEEDGTFPKGPPNPLLPENRDETIDLIKKAKPDFGVAWDADADRVFFFTGDGVFVPSAFIVALLAPEFLKKYPGAKIVHDLTTAWVIDDAIEQAGGTPVANRTGHTFIKARMRKEKAPFGGESSGHYYFKDSFYADNGIVPFLKVLELVSASGKSLAQLVAPMMDKNKLSGEINFMVKDAPAKMTEIEEKFAPKGKVDKTDGVVIESGDWRFSVRSSNTEPLLRLNVESRDKVILDKLVTELTDLINT